MRVSSDRSVADAARCSAVWSAAAPGASITDDVDHARQLMAFVAVFVGAYMVISGLVRLLT